MSIEVQIQGVVVSALYDATSTPKRCLATFIFHYGDYRCELCEIEQNTTDNEYKAMIPGMMYSIFSDCIYVHDGILWINAKTVISATTALDPDGFQAICDTISHNKFEHYTATITSPGEELREDHDAEYIISSFSYEQNKLIRKGENHV